MALFSGKNTKKYSSIFQKFSPVFFSFLLLTGTVIATVNFSGLSTPAGQVTGGRFQTTFDNISAPSGCWAGNYLQWFTSTGVLICKSIATFPTLTLSNTTSNYTITGSGLYAQYLKNILNDCGNGRYVRGFDSSTKKMICSDKDGNETTIGISITPSPYASIHPASAPAPEKYTTYFNNMFSNDCGSQKAITGFDVNGLKTGCGNMPRNASCTSLPANASWNTVNIITQTWNGSSWTPSDVGSYGATASTTSCRFKCNVNYTWNGMGCVANTQTHTCPSKPATGTVWNSVASYTQTWNGSAWSPAADTNTSYSTTPSTTACIYKCATNYTWDGNSCKHVNLIYSTPWTYTFTLAWSSSVQIRWIGWGGGGAGWSDGGYTHNGPSGLWGSAAISASAYKTLTTWTYTVVVWSSGTWGESYCYLGYGWSKGGNTYLMDSSGANIFNASWGNGGALNSHGNDWYCSQSPIPSMCTLKGTSWGTSSYGAWGGGWTRGCWKPGSNALNYGAWGGGWGGVIWSCCANDGWAGGGWYMEILF